MKIENYDKLDAVRISNLVNALRSPIHYQHAANDNEDKPAYHFGRFFHTLLLERPMVTKRYVLFDPSKRPNQSLNPKGNPFGMTQKDNAAWKDQMIANAEKENKEIISLDDYQTAKEMAKSVMAVPEARAYLEAKGEFERVKTWTDKETGIECKGRVDKWLTNRKVIVEVKTARDASTDKFSRDAYSMEYHTKAAWYLDGFGASRFVFIVVEKTAPYAVNILTASSEFLDHGRISYRACLKTVATCRKTHGKETEGKRWPGYEFVRSGWEELELPPWMRTK